MARSSGCDTELGLRKGDGMLKKELGEDIAI
jgi:hypothetical protein